MKNLEHGPINISKHAVDSQWWNQNKGVATHISSGALTTREHSDEVWLMKNRAGISKNVSLRSKWLSVLNIKRTNS